ncbi:PREDICTED: uncharacterized protein LOC104772096 [Camelina sativa]|uniref:Uncharacterized protein LOC104772096 n=1 Tax=Camelina sativa TaxID=90675 RepID=A0ABM0Y3X3_CAMSA|nr:PREDICTED: uncharacterized protein LOC104772096 [Camelina sativa]
MEEGYEIREEKEMFDWLEGNLLKVLGERSVDEGLKFTYLMGSVESFSRIKSCPLYSAYVLFDLVDQFQSVVYYEKSLRHAKKALDFLGSLIRIPENTASLPELLLHQKFLGFKIANLEDRIAAGLVPEMPVGPPPLNRCRIGQVQDTEDDARMRLSWLRLDDGSRRGFMKVRIADFKTYVEAKTDGGDDLEKVLGYLKKKEKWVAWICRTCETRFSTRDECKHHIEQEHSSGSSRKHRPQRDHAWANKIRFGSWEPVDAVAAVQMIRNRFADVKAFAYQDGWCKDWPLATDVERSALLQGIRSLLVTFIEHKVLVSDCFRERVIHSLVKELDVSREKLSDCRLLETPQSICFLASNELNMILVFLRKIKCNRDDDGTKVVCRAVDTLWQSTRFKERIDVDPHLSFLLLDKRLLRGQVKHFDDEGKVNFIEPNAHCARVRVPPREQGHGMLTWLQDRFPGVDGFAFPKSVFTHNSDIWVAVMRGFNFNGRTLESKHAKRLALVGYYEALTTARQLCQTESDMKPNGVKQFGALLLSEQCKKNATKESFIRAVQDVMKGSAFQALEDCPDLEYVRKANAELMSKIESLQLNVMEKVALIDCSIFLVEDSTKKLLECLTDLAFFDYRSYISTPLKKYLVDSLLGRE